MADSGTVSYPDRSSPEGSGPGALAGRASDVVLAVLHDASAGRGDGPAELMAWCERAMEAQVRLVAPGGVVGLEVAAGQRAEVDALARGHTTAPVVMPGGVVTPVGRLGRGRRHLLVAARPESFTEAEVAALERIADGLAVALWVRRLIERADRLAAAAAGLRVAALQQLMAGDLVRAGRTLEPLVPGLVATGAGRVAIVEGARGEARDVLAEEVDAAVGDRALIVLCPVSEQQVIVIHPSSRDGLAAALGDVVRQVKGRSAGISVVTPWHGTASAYETAVAALAQARGTRSRVQVHDGRPPLAEQLGADARMLSALILQPLQALPRAQRQELVDVALQALWWGLDQAEKLVGWSADTLAARLDTLGELTGLDRSDPWQRAALYLAVQLATLPEPVVLDPRVRLDQVLDHPAARAWAQRTLGPLDRLKAPRGRPTARQVAVCWLLHNRRPAPVMAELGIGHSTVYRRLAQVAAATHLEVTQYDGHRWELMLALAVAGDIPVGSLPPLARDLDGPEAGGHPMVLGPEINTGKPHTARMYDYFLGGKTNYAADRKAAQKVLAASPETVPSVASNRAYIQRAIRVVAGEGVDQFFDIGTGIPTSPNLHEAAQSINPRARVVYIDNDPIVLAHAAALLEGTPEGRTVYAMGDIHQGAALYDLTETRETLDLSRPVCLCLHGLLHFVEGQPAYDLVHALTARLVPGSYLSISHFSADFAPERVQAVVEQYHRGGLPAEARSKDQIRQFFAAAAHSATILEPGIVPPQQWRPAPDDEPWPADMPYMGYAALAVLGA